VTVFIMRFIGLFIRAFKILFVFSDVHNRVVIKFGMLYGCSLKVMF
jgi:hypothetical protein